MGYLHDGHMALVNRARVETEVVVASIFVNPAQFAAHEDLDTYPQVVFAPPRAAPYVIDSTGALQDTGRDLQLLEAAGVDAVLLPPREELYGACHSIVVDPGADFAQLAEGKARGAHFFRGVATIVTKVCRCQLDYSVCDLHLSSGGGWRSFSTLLGLTKRTSGAARA